MGDQLGCVGSVVGFGGGWEVLCGRFWFGVFYSFVFIGQNYIICFCIRVGVFWGNEGVRMVWVLKLFLVDEVIEFGLVQDFDVSFFGIGQELGVGVYSMR